MSSSLRLSAGGRIGRYDVLAPIGAGGMGEVYRALDRRLEREVAVKVLPAALAADSQWLERFEREARSLAALSHPRICTLYDLGEHEGSPFLVMELLQGSSLEERLAGGPLEPPVVVDLAAQIADALAVAHAKGIVHRDVKPANVFVSDDDQVKVLDFGLAKTIAKPRAGSGEAEQVTATLEKELTSAGTRVGTVSYMSPEQILGDPLDHATDLFSLGVVVYEMATGTNPFRRASSAAVVAAILRNHPTPAHTVESAVPPELSTIIGRCLAKEPEARCSADELRDALRRLGRDLDHASRAGPPADAETAQASPRLAVLPFSNMRSDPESDFLGYALADEVINRLSFFQGLVIRPSSSVRKFAGSSVDPRAAAAELRVDNVLAGSFLKEEGRLRVSLELVDVDAEESLWRERFDVDFESVFELQEMVSQRVTDGLAGHFSDRRPGSEERLAPSDPRAYEHFLRSLSFPLTNEGSVQAVETLDQALALDPEFAPAHYQRGFRLHQLGTYAPDGMDDFERAEASLRRAVELDPGLLPALDTLANMCTERGRFAEAAELLGRSFDLKPDNPYAHCTLGYGLRYAGMLEASRAAFERALEHDPTNPVFRTAAITYALLGEYDAAIRACHLDPASAFAISWKGAIYLMMGRDDAAMTQFDMLLAIEDEGIFAEFARGLKASIDGELEAGLEATRRWAENQLPDSESRFCLAANFALLGDREACLRELVRALDGHYCNAAGMENHPFFESVRDDPAFVDLVAVAKARRREIEPIFSRYLSDLEVRSGSPASRRSDGQSR